jgi:hypothetical protein
MSEKEVLDSWKLEKRRGVPTLVPGVIAKVVGRSGHYKIRRLDYWAGSGPETEVVEALCWWVSATRSPSRAQWRTLRVKGPGAVRISSVL